MSSLCVGEDALEADAEKKFSAAKNWRDDFEENRWINVDW